MLGRAFVSWPLRQDAASPELFFSPTLAVVPDGLICYTVRRLDELDCLPERALWAQAAKAQALFDARCRKGIRDQVTGEGGRPGPTRSRMAATGCLRVHFPTLTRRLGDNGR
jgi:hypothetical protein